MFTDAQRGSFIRQGEDGTSVEEICRKAGISQATYFNWKKTYAGLKPEAHRTCERCQINRSLETHGREPSYPASSTATRAIAKAVIPAPRSQ